MARFLETDSDFERMKDLLRDNYVVTARIEYPGPCDLEYWRYIYDDSPDLVRNTRLWEDEDGRLAAFAWINPDGTDLSVRSGAEALLPEVLSWSESERLSGGLLGEPFDFNRIGLRADAEAVIAVAEGLGYRRTGIRTAVFVQEPWETAARIEPPLGVQIRSLRRDELAERSRLGGVAQDSEVAPANYDRLWSESTVYSPDLDIVAEVSGELVAFCTGWADQRTNVGLLEPFGCRAEFRRRGLARAVVSECVRRLADRGMARVYTTHGGLGPDETEDDTTRFDLSMGLHEVAGVVEMLKEGMG
jgi:GNAT superfamily N-acetyltransferase